MISNVRKFVLVTVVYLFVLNAEAGVGQTSIKPPSAELIALPPPPDEDPPPPDEAPPPPPAPPVRKYILNPGESMSNGQFISSRNGSYKLIMQSDGSFVMYRADGSVRYRMAKYGTYAVMQVDGNLVEYNGGTAIWASGTSGRCSGCWLEIYDDGDLAIGSHNSDYSYGYVVWSIGADPGPGDPTLSGDVLGRDLAFTGAGYLGHLGIWDGGQVFEAGPAVDGNAIHITTLDSFKHTPTNTGGIAAFWGTAPGPIPSGNTWICPNEYNCTFAVTRPARTSLAMRAMQIYRIGADYTITAAYTHAVVPSEYQPAQRGVYRCDTFVIDVMWSSTLYEGTPNVFQQAWIDRWRAMKDGAKTPSIIFNTLKSYAY